MSVKRPHESNTTLNESGAYIVWFLLAGPAVAAGGTGWISCDSVFVLAVLQVREAIRGRPAEGDISPQWRESNLQVALPGGNQLTCSCRLSFWRQWWPKQQPPGQWQLLQHTPGSTPTSLARVFGVGRTKRTTMSDKVECNQWKEVAVQQHIY